MLRKTDNSLLSPLYLSQEHTSWLWPKMARRATNNRSDYKQENWHPDEVKVSKEDCGDIRKALEALGNKEAMEMLPKACR